MRRMFPYLMLIPALAAGFLWWRSEQGRLAALDHVAELEAHLALSAVLRPIEPPPVELSTGQAAAPASPHATPVHPGLDAAQYLRMIDELRDQLKEQSKELSAARDASVRAEETLAAEQGESKKLRAQLDDLRDDLQASRRLTEAIQVELRAKSGRLVKAEASEKLVRERLARSESSVAKVAAATKEMEDLNRRREAVVTSLLRRYREVSDLYRNFSMNAQTRETPAVAGLQAGDLSRIQSAIQQAEDDLRQVESLNARMAQLAKVQ